jgi:predicted DNA-binding ribbon-helix-helix protein
MRIEPGTNRRSLARTTTIELEHDLVVRLRSEAAGRQMSVVRLVQDLLEVILTDGLTAAILDVDD